MGVAYMWRDDDVFIVLFYKSVDLFVDGTCIVVHLAINSTGEWMEVDGMSNKFR